MPSLTELARVLPAAHERWNELSFEEKATTVVIAVGVLASMWIGLLAGKLEVPEKPDFPEAAPTSPIAPTPPPIFHDGEIMTS